MSTFYYKFLNQEMNIPSILFKTLKPIGFVPARLYNRNLPEPIQYYGFKYYPRHKNFKDPPYEPSKLFLVKRIKPMKGRTPKEINALALLNVDGNERYKRHINIVKNIPEINALLWKVKHLVAIKPITYKGELPKDDFSGTYLRETGELAIMPKLKASEEEMKSTEKYVEDKQRLISSYFKKYLLKKWESGYEGHV